MKNKCEECKYYHKENNTCQSKKCATGGTGKITLLDLYQIAERMEEMEKELNK